MRQNTEFNRSANRNLQTILRAQLDTKQREIMLKKGELDKLVQDGKVVLAKPPPLNPNRALKNDNDQTLQPTFSSLTEEQLHGTISEMLRTDLDLIEAESRLAVLEKQQDPENQAHQEDNAQLSQPDDEQLKDRIEEEFQKDPDVIALVREIKETGEQLDRAKAMARLASDPARRAAEKQYKKLTEEYAELWDGKYKGIKKRLQVVAGSSKSPDAINELKIKVASLKKKRESQARMLETVKIESKTTSIDTHNAMLLDHDLGTLMTDRDHLKRNLEQLQFEALREDFRVELLDKASVPKTPTNSKMLKYMAAAPVGILFTVLGLFLLLEIKAQRVDDPDTLSTRVGSEVYALPPLQTTRPIRKLSAKATDQIEQFIQRLDHLRFAVCSNPVEPGKGRCVLITSAISAEGKSTLAMSLAARCGHAGMSTLLIDGDLLGANLCRKLDEPEGPGLSDVLEGKATFDDVVIPVQGGAFYLLRAGTPIAAQDIGRVLQSRNFAPLIIRLRQLYDLVIIDSPPVLPVPDALILGRCADGAVLVARYDISRFPQVERARRQLNNAGIAILGTVINDMRHSDSYYGRYSYNRQRSSQPNSSNAI